MRHYGRKYTTGTYTIVVETVGRAVRKQIGVTDEKETA